MNLPSVLALRYWAPIGDVRSIENGGCFVILGLPNPAVGLASQDKVGMSSGIDDGAVLHHQDSICPEDRRWSMGNYDQSSGPAKVFQSMEKGGRGWPIERACDLVHNENSWLLQKSASQSQPLPFSPRELCPEWSQRFVETPRKPAKNLVELRERGNLIQVTGSGQWISVEKIAPDRFVKQDRVLRDQADHGAKTATADLLGVTTSDEN